MSKREKDKYIKQKKAVFEDLCIPLSEDVLKRMANCQSEIAIDNIAHSVILNHQYSRVGVRGA